MALFLIFILIKNSTYFGQTSLAVNINRRVKKEFDYIGRTYCFFWNMFTILTFLYNI